MFVDYPEDIHTEFSLVDRWMTWSGKTSHVAGETRNGEVQLGRGDPKEASWPTT